MPQLLYCKTQQTHFPHIVYIYALLPPDVKKRSQIFNLEYSIFYDLDIYILILRVCHKHPPIFVILSVGKSFGVTPKSVGFHRFSQTKLTDNLKKNRWKNQPIFMVRKSRPIFLSVGKSFGGTQALVTEFSLQIVANCNR